MRRLRESRTSEPAKLAVGLQEAKAHLRIPDSDVADDPLIEGMLRTAILQCEAFTGRALITQTWTAYLDYWPSDYASEDIWEGYRDGAETQLFTPLRAIELNHSPLQSVTSITTYDDADSGTAYASANYFVDTASTPGRLVLRNSAAMPITTRAANGIEIVYVAGYGDDQGDVPQSLRDGILRYVAHAYEHRGEDLTADGLRAASGSAIIWQADRVERLR